MRTVIATIAVLLLGVSLGTPAHASGEHIDCSFDPKEVANTADYIVDPSASGTHVHNLLSDAIADAQVYGDLDADEVVEICVNGGTEASPNVYTDTAVLPTNPWTGVLNGGPSDPILIWSPHEFASALFEPATIGDSILTIDNLLGGISARRVTVKNLGFVDGNADDGGAVKIMGSTVSLGDLFVADNSATNQGGGLHVTNSDVAMADGVFLNNAATYGGGIYENGNQSFVIRGTYLESNTADTGGGLYQQNNSNLLIDNATFYANAAVRGGAVHLPSRSGSNTIRKSTFEGNVATIANTSAGGGALWLTPGFGSSTVSVETSLFIDNYADNGGAIFCNCRAAFSGNTFEQNTAKRGGAWYSVAPAEGVTFYQDQFIGNSAELAGAVWTQPGYAITFTQATFDGNEATFGQGGAILSMYQSTFPDNALHIHDSSFTDNAANNGGAVFASSIDTIIDNTTFTNNRSSSTGHGGAISALLYANRSLNIHVTDSQFTGNRARKGGAIGFYGVSGLQSTPTVLYLESNNFTGNIGEYLGGAVHSEFAEVNSDMDVFTGNRADKGGAISVTDVPELDIDEATFDGNYLTSNFPWVRYGGAIYAQASGLDVSGSTITNSSCQTASVTCYGGAISLEDGSTATLTDTAVTSNSSEVGGAIYAVLTDLTLSNVLIAFNQAPVGAAINADGVDVTFVDSTVAGNGSVSGVSPAVDLGVNSTIDVQNSIFAFNEDEELSVGSGSTVTIDGSDLYDATGTVMSGSVSTAHGAGTGNISQDPMFIGNGGTDTNPMTTLLPLTFDFYLQTGSPATGMGIY